MTTKKIRRRWAEYYDLPEIKKIRKLIKDSYSDKLQFIEETHQYFLDGVEYTCVSDIIKRWENNDREAMLEGCAKKAQWKMDYKYYGMTKDEIRELWDKSSKEACDFGTLVHGFGESMFYWEIGEDDKILPEYKEQFAGDEPIAKNKHEEAVIHFWKDIPDDFVPVLAETKVFNKEGTPYAGTFDILFYYYKGKRSEGQEFESIQGVLIYSYDAFRLAPRAEDDFVKGDIEACIRGDSELAGIAFAASVMFMGELSKKHFQVDSQIRGEYLRNSEVRFYTQVENPGGSFFVFALGLDFETEF